MVDLSKGLARRLHAVREKQRLTQDDVADRARGLGLEWGRDTVAKIETGHRELKLVEFLLLPLILSTTLADLVPVADYIELTALAAVPSGAFLGLLAGEPNIHSQLMWAAPHLVVDLQPPPIKRDALREAERKAAKRLGLDPIELSILAHKRWGMGLTEKRDQLLTEQAKAGDARTRQALRGWVTRQLDKELADKEVKT
jgi:transcriptional regulator with XRE-family HTH domain